MAVVQDPGAQLSERDDLRRRFIADVLVVDDTPANLQLMACMLKEHGYKVRPVPSGALALRAARSRPPDVVLLDVNMPEMDGYQLCRNLKQDPTLAGIPVLFISALSEPIDKVRAFAAGGVDYVTKPFQIDEVHARISTHLRLVRMQQELTAKNDALELSYGRLRDMEALRDTLTDMVAHDMRSPLTGVLAALQFLREDLSEQAPAASLQDISLGLEGVRRVVRMIDDLLDISRMEVGQLPVKPVPCKLDELVASALEALSAHGRGRHLDLNGLEQAPMLCCDPELIRRVLVNLLHNALKFTAEGGVVRIDFEQIPQGEIMVRVTDSGPGLAEEERLIVFEKYGQARLRAEGRRAHSSGLGLAFCRLAVEAHGGTIGVNSELDSGSTFWFRLPLAAES